MSESSMFWNGLVLGDADLAPYEADTVFSEFVNDILGGPSNSGQGFVVRGALNELACSVVGATVTLNTGRGWCYGSRYINTATISFVLPVPSGATRKDLIIMNKDWAGQQVRAARLQGVEGGPVPTLTQSVGTTWQTGLYEADITTGGVVTLTDLRKFGGGAGVKTVTASATLDCQGQSSITVTGTATYTDVINVPAAGTFVTVNFQAAGCNITNGNHWKLVNNFVSTAGGGLLLFSDGSNLWEVSRMGSSTQYGGIQFQNSADAGRKFQRQSGSAVCNPNGSSTISWPTTFATTPVCMAVCSGGGVQAAVTEVTNVTTTGATVNCISGGGLATVNFEIWGLG